MLHSLIARALVGAAVFTSAASADFISIVIREDKTLPPATNLPPNLRVFNMYARFDGPGSDSGQLRVNTVDAVFPNSNGPSVSINLAGNPGANFFEINSGATGPRFAGPDIATAAPRAYYTTYVSIGRKYRDSSAGIGDVTGSDALTYQNTDGLNGPASLGLGGGFDAIYGGWYDPSKNPTQGAASDPNDAFYTTFLAQFSIANLAPAARIGQFTGALIPDSVHPGQFLLEFQSDIFRGRLSVFRLGETENDTLVEIPIIFTALPPAHPSDLNADGMTNSADLALLLGAWGQPGPSDLNHDGTTNSGDLALLLGAWGPNQ